VVTLRIPPLRERGADLLLLAEHYLGIFCKEHGKPVKTLTPEALQALQAHSWPGNVRELRNVLESLVIFHQGDAIQVADLPPELRGGAAAEASAPTSVAVAASAPAAAPQQLRTMDEIERQAILDTLRRTGGRRAEAAQLLGIGLRTLQRKLKDYKLQGFISE
jgi:DNA-binding NtrC family response regulator